MRPASNPPAGRLVTHRAEPSTDDLVIVEFMRHLRDDMGLSRDQLVGMLGCNRLPVLEAREAELMERGRFEAMRISRGR
jgi:hypothetical protein